jgi:hypothetical protein
MMTARPIQIQRLLERGVVRLWSEILKEDKSGFTVLGGVAIRRLLLGFALITWCGYEFNLLKISIL